MRLAVQQIQQSPQDPLCQAGHSRKDQRNLLGSNLKESIRAMASHSELSCQFNLHTQPRHKTNIMFSTLKITVVLALLSAFSAAGNAPSEERAEMPTLFKAPSLTPVLHLSPLVMYPTNASNVFGTVARVPNLAGKHGITRNFRKADTAGKFNGKFSGEILELGAAEEVVVPSRDGIQTVNALISFCPP
jgi:hypothetical protein